MQTWRAINEILAPLMTFKSEVEKRIELYGGGSLDFWSLEDPDTVRGNKYKRIIVDECEYVKNFETTWTLVLRATLVDLQGDAWFLSTPKFGATFFKKLSQKEDENWMAWRFTTYDNPYMPLEEIQEIEATLDEASFRCEYLAEDVTLAVNKFIYNFSREKHIEKGLQAIPNLPILLSFDFNTEPITCLVGQCDGLQKVRILDEYRLMNSDIDELCERILSDFSDKMLIVTGDASGQNRTALKRDLNYYKEIKRILRLGMGQFKIPAANPRIKNTRVLCNSLLGRHTDYKFSDRVPYLVMDIEECEVTSEGDIDKSKDKHQSHLLDCWRYFNWTFLNKFLDLRVYENGADIYGNGNQNHVRDFPHAVRGIPGLGRIN